MSIFRSKRSLAAMTAMIGLALPAALVAPAEAAPNNNSVKKLTKAVTVEGVLDHLDALQNVADANGGDRAAGRPGYGASVAYVVDQLTSSGVFADGPGVRLRVRRRELRTGADRP